MGSVECGGWRAQSDRKGIEKTSMEQRWAYLGRILGPAQTFL